METTTGASPDILSTPLNITAIRIEGASRTRRNFLDSLIAPVLATASSPEHDSTLGSVLLTSRRIGHILYKTDIFKSVEARVEKSHDTPIGSGNVDIIFKTIEKGRLYLNSSTEFGNGEGNVSITGRVRSMFGGAETAEVNLSLGTKTRRSLHAILSAPLSSSLDTRGELSIFSSERDNSSYASSSEGLRGLRAVVKSGRHEFACEAALRHIGNLMPSASLSIREAAGRSFKSSISHTWTRDTRDDKLMATRGYYSKLFQELAGFGSSASFYKVEGEGQLSRPLISGVTWSFAARAGLLCSFSGSSRFSDRFQLGGPLSIRSFRANSMGPRDGSDSLGGDLYWSTGLSLISDIPHKPHWPLKLHAYLNTGRLDVLDQSRLLPQSIRDCLLRPAVSAGFGLLYCFDPVRVELNFGVPLATSKSDGLHRGFQVGIGLDFL